MGPLLQIFKKKTSIEDRLTLIKSGNMEERDKFISEYIPFIIKSITKVTNRYIEIENNDEYSIGLEAFNEAINRYELSKGTFIKFAETVIRSRIIDYQRKVKNVNKIISLNNGNLNNENEGKIELQDSLKEDDFTKSLDIKDQISRLKDILKVYDITLEELIEESPKHVDSRINAINIARQISKDEELMEIIRDKKILPMKRITEKIDVTKKILKGNRKFIIATVIILDKDLDLLASYISAVEGRVKHGI